MKKILSVFICVHLWFVSMCFANSGASFLNIGTSARAISMGGAYVGVANDVSAINYNPAGLAQLNRNEITAQHTEWISDVKHDFLAGAFPLKNSTIGISVVALTQGKLEGRDEKRNKTDSFSAYDVATTIYSKKINEKIKLGTNLKIIQQKIETEYATGVAIDMGTLYNTAVKNLTVGFSFQNLGPQMTFISEGYNLPLTATVGFGYTLKRAITLAFDVKRKIIDNKTEISFGTEYTPINILALRAGYLLINKSTSEQMNASGFFGFGGGFGLRVLNFSTDYAFVPYGDLGNTHRVSFSVRF